MYKQNPHKDGFFKVCEELQIEINDFRQAELILNALGLKRVKYWEKYRTSYHLGKVKVEIDELPGIPPFIELEGNREEIEKFVSLLGFSMEDTTSMHGGKILKKYGRDSDNLHF